MTAPNGNSGVFKASVIALRMKSSFSSETPVKFNVFVIFKKAVLLFILYSSFSRILRKVSFYLKQLFLINKKQ